MAIRDPQGGGREPYNIPIRLYGAGGASAEEEYLALLRDIRALLASAVRRGVIPFSSVSKSRANRRAAR